MSEHAAEAEAARYARRRLRLSIATFPETRGWLGAVVLSVILIVAAIVVARINRPPASVALRDGDAVVTPSGAVFVIDGGIAYPAVNATSARLAADRVISADATALRAFPRGPARGIPDAPASLPTATDLAGDSWQLCTAGSSNVTVSFGSAPYLSPAASEQVVLDDGDRTWVVRDGARLTVNDATGLPAIATIPELTALIPTTDGGSVATTTALPGGLVVCAQSDPAAPFARPSVAAVERATVSGKGVAVAGSRGPVAVSMRPGAGVLAPASAGGYWLLTSSGELNLIDDDRALRRLGLSKDDARLVPEAILSLLQPGPTLSIDAARAQVSAPPVSAAE